MGGTKVQLKVYISRRTDQLLRKYISERHGEFRRGLLSEVVEEAILQFIEGGARTHTDNYLPRNNNSSDNGIRPLEPPRSAAKVMAIVMALPRQGKVTEDDLREIIAQVAGYDPRTVRKYISILNDIYKVIQKEAIMWQGRRRVVVYSVDEKRVRLLLNEFEAPLDVGGRPQRLWL